MPYPWNRVRTLPQFQPESNLDPSLCQTFSGLREVHDAAGVLLGVVWGGDPLAAADPFEAGVGAVPGDRHGLFLVRSGPIPGDGLSWLPESRRRFARFVEGVEAGLAARASGLTPVIWPHAGGVISDIPSLQTFMRSAIDRSWQWVFDPGWLMTESMKPMAADHFRRFAELLAPTPGMALWVEDRAWAGVGAGGGGEAAAGAGEGADWRRLPRLVRAVPGVP